MHRRFSQTAITNYDWKLALGMAIWKHPFEIIDKLTHLLRFWKFVRKLECLVVHCHFGYLAREKGVFVEHWNNRTYDSASHYLKQLANFLLSAKWMTAIRQAEISFLRFDLVHAFLFLGLLHVAKWLPYPKVKIIDTRLGFFHTDWNFLSGVYFKTAIAFMACVT